MKKRYQFTIILCAVLLVSALLFSASVTALCAANDAQSRYDVNADGSVDIRDVTSLLDVLAGNLPENKIKNVIYLIPDGAGFGTYDIANAYKKKYAPFAVDGIVDGVRDTASAAQRTPITTNAVSGKTVTGLYLDEYLIASANTDMYHPLGHPGNTATDSAAAGTALLCGVKTDYVMVGIDHAFRPAANILELARLEGKATGAVSTKCSVDATTSDMVAHLLRRPDQNSCAYQPDVSAQMLNNNIDIQLMYGTDGGRYPYKKNFADSVPVSDDTAANHGYTVVTDLASLNAAVVEGKAKIFSSFQIDYLALGEGYDLNGSNYYTGSAAWNTDYQAHHILYDVDAREGDLTLLSMAKAALTMLDKNVNDPDGFCLVIEGGAIDNACEGRNVKEGVAEYLAFDEVFGYCVNWAAARGDTVVVACPDHDSGGFFDPENNAGAPKQGNRDFDSLDDLLTALHDGTVADRTTLDGFASGHTAQNVPVWLYAPDDVRAQILEYLGLPADAAPDKVRTGRYYNGSVFDPDYQILNSDIAGAVVKAAGLMTFSEATEKLFVPVYDANDPSKYGYGAYDPETAVFTFSNGARVERNSRVYFDKNGDPHELSCGLPIFLTNPVRYHTEDGSDVYLDPGKATAVFYVPQEILDAVIPDGE
ncbi:MAG: alkaline phosphatase [Clostridia bacterium]|nr:alkaline phosphatase [Clostridia bacterium]